MNNLNKITKILGVTFVLATSGSVLAATVSTSATATVQNAFTLTEDTALSFGTIRATVDNTGALNIASLILAADGTVSTSEVEDAKISQLSPGSVAQFTIADAAAFTVVTVDFPADFTLTAAVAPAGSPVFHVKDASWTAIIRGGSNDGLALVAGTTDLITNNAGTVSFDAGTTLTTDTTVTSVGNYLDETYTGNYTMTVNY